MLNPVASTVGEKTMMINKACKWLSPNTKDAVDRIFHGYIFIGIILNENCL